MADFDAFIQAMLRSQAGVAKGSPKQLGSPKPQLPAVRSPGSEVAPIEMRPGSVPGELVVDPAKGAAGSISPLMRRLLIAAGLGVPATAALGLYDELSGDSGAIPAAAGDPMGDVMGGDVIPASQYGKFGIDNSKKKSLRNKVAQRKPAQQTETPVPINEVQGNLKPTLDAPFDRDEFYRQYVVR